MVPLTRIFRYAVNLFFSIFCNWLAIFRPPRAQLFKIVGCCPGAVRCIRSARLGRSASVASSVYCVWHVDLCAILCTAVYHIHGVCNGNGYHDVHRIRYHWRLASTIPPAKINECRFYTVERLRGVHFQTLSLLSFSLDTPNCSHSQILSEFEEKNVHCRQIKNFVWLAGTLITVASALLFGFLGSVIIFFMFFGFVLLAGYFGLVQIYEIFDNGGRGRTIFGYVIGRREQKTD